MESTNDLMEQSNKVKKLKVGNKVFVPEKITVEDLIKEEESREWNNVAIKYGLTFRKIIENLRRILDDPESRPSDIIKVCEIAIKIKGAYAPEKHQVAGIGGVKMIINVDDREENGND